MNKTIYRKTRYQNIYMNIKNRNYIIQISNPKTTISKIDGNKIIDLNVAVDYRNKVIKRNSITSFKAVSGTFEYYWTNYINYCKNDVKMAFTTLKSKRIVYNTYCKKIKNNKIDKISKEIGSKYYEV